EKFGDVEVEVIPNPIQQTGIKTEKNLDEFRVLYVGRLVWYKGIHILLKTFRELKNGNARLLIAGSGPEFETVKRFSHLDPRITPLGFISEAEKQKLLRDASLTVIPSLWCEPFPMTALESFANGTPVAASKIGGLPEIVKDGYNGRLFKPGDTDHLKKIFIELAENGNDLRTLQDGAIKSVLQYHIHKHVKKLENMYGSA
ncbi:MAG: glycosyltransferase, partial [Candidatus Micrarchaeota archaeon]|nr:glycosyltransferase [Candidatus Micrarchaeota archaeon]